MPKIKINPEEQLAQAIDDLFQESGEPDFYDALGRMTEADVSGSAKLNEEQRQRVARAIRIRGFSDIDELMKNPEYAAKVEKGESFPEGSTDPIWGQTIVGNILSDVEHGLPMYRATPDYAFQYRDALLAQTKSTN